jgi:hypothetical protein
MLIVTRAAEKGNAGVHPAAIAVTKVCKANNLSGKCGVFRQINKRIKVLTSSGEPAYAYLVIITLVLFHAR